MIRAVATLAALSLCAGAATACPDASDKALSASATRMTPAPRASKVAKAAPAKRLLAARTTAAQTKPSGG